MLKSTTSDINSMFITSACCIFCRYQALFTLRMITNYKYIYNENLFSPPIDNTVLFITVHLSFVISLFKAPFTPIIITILAYTPTEDSILFIRSSYSSNIVYCSYSQQEWKL